MNPPTGKVTFLFTDIEGRTRLAQENDENYDSSLAKQHEILHEIISRNDGFVFKITGDAFCCSFSECHRAVNAAVDLQSPTQSIPVSMIIAITVQAITVPSALIFEFNIR